MEPKVKQPPEEGVEDLRRKLVDLVDRDEKIYNQWLEEPYRFGGVRKKIYLEILGVLRDISAAKGKK
jgi:hypothetical protein